jgi:stalled ribosome rescue protein Dom34
MASCVLWIDRENAKIFKLSSSGVDKKEMKHHDIPPFGAHHDNHKHNAEEKFYHDVATAIGQVEELLIMGPGVAKTHFKNHLEKHNHKDLLGKVVGVEALESMTDNQVLEASRKFFKKTHLFN